MKPTDQEITDMIESLMSVIMKNVVPLEVITSVYIDKNSPFTPRLQNSILSAVKANRDIVSRYLEFKSQWNTNPDWTLLISIENPVMVMSAENYQEHTTEPSEIPGKFTNIVDWIRKILKC